MFRQEVFKINKYKVTGMSCAACSARVEKAVSKVSGVKVCSVNLLTNTLSVDGNAREEDIFSAVEKAGYGISGANGRETEKSNTDKDMKKLKLRLFWSLIFLAILMYFSMGNMMFSFPIPKAMENNHIAMGLLQMLLTIIIMVINQKFFVSGFKGLVSGSPNMDTLVSIGSGASFLYSTFALFKMTDATVNGNSDLVMKYMNEFYFESAAMILTLITVGKTLEAYSKGKTTNAIKSLMDLSPKTATVIRNGQEIEISAKDVRVGDIFTVRPGESIPVDGIITEGESAINESSLTGESIPADKSAGDNVYAATINQSGFIKCRAVKVGEDTTLSQIIKMVNDASSQKAPIAKIADKVSGVFVPSVMGISMLTLAVWLLCGYSFGFSLARAISVLVISCPCALGLATPVAIMVGNGVGAKNGILFKTAASLEETGKIKIAVFDKTGTITKGCPKVTDIVPFGDADKNHLLKIAYSIEEKSEHPLSKAIVSKALEENITPYEITEFLTLPGNGISGKINGNTVFAGNLKFVSEKINIPKEMILKSEKFADEGKTPLYFCEGEKLLGLIVVSDIIKDDSFESIKTLKNMGIKTVMLTGDNKKTANAIGKLSGVDEIISEVMPDEKAGVVQNFKKDGKVLMVGDGINDAPALTGADIGMAIGTGTDVAIDAADVVLMKSNLADVVSAIKLSRATLKNIRENLFWAFIYNIIGIPLAAGVLLPVFNIGLNPMFSAAAMSMSSFCVVTNALRLNFVNINKNTENVNKKEIKTMEKILKIEGMMCPHCEANVKKALESISGVESAEADHTSKTAKVVLSSDVSDEILKSAVEAQGYKVL